MTSTWPITAAVAAAAGYAFRGYRSTVGDPTPVAPDLDIAKAGQLFALAADWLRTGDVEAARALLAQVPAEIWELVRDEVVATSQEPRIAAFADRMSADTLLAAPAETSAHANRLAQVETLNAIATAIRTRMRPAR